MDPWLVAALIFAAVFGASFLIPKDEVAKPAFLAGLIGAIFFLGMSSWVVIQTRHEGIPISFGTAGGTYKAGFHWKAPWSQVRKYDATLQTKNYGARSDDDGDPFKVNLNNGAWAKLDITYQWRLSDDIRPIFHDYPTASTGDLNQLIVKREVQQQLNLAYANFDPTATLAAKSAALIAQLKDPNYKQTPVVNDPTQAVNGAGTFIAYGESAKAALVTALKTQGIEFTTLTIADINYDPETAKRLNSLNQSIINTLNAIQGEATAEAQAAANAAIAKNPPTIEQNRQACIDATAKDPSSFPIGWNCNFGADSSVLVGANGTKAKAN